jgi:hypothetical protein
LEATSEHDTVWVRPGIYLERLIFPPHDVVLVSDYFMTGDTNAIASTIIDASSFAGLDTASVLVFADSMMITRATLVGGFTLTGGNGTVSFAPDQRFGGAIWMWWVSPTIHSCWITGNAAHVGPAIFGYGCSARISHCRLFHNCARYQQGFAFHGADNFAMSLIYSDTLVYEWNEVYENVACDSSYFVTGGGLLAQSWDYLYGVVVVEFNHFHDYTCVGSGGVATNGVRLLLRGNLFENVHVVYGGDFVVNVNSNQGAVVADNIVRNITMADEAAVVIGDNGAIGVLIERNWFESDSNGGYGPSGLMMFSPQGDMRDNVFTNCRGHVGAVQFSQQTPEGCGVLFERDAFYGNRAYGSSLSPSAFSTLGVGPGCTFINNWFEGNEGVAVGVVPGESVTLDVSGNYWGDPSGPYDSLNNPNGQGDTLGYNTFASTWLTEPPELNAEWPERLRLAPADWTLEHPHPNPFNATTRFMIRSLKPQPFEVAVYNTLGQRVGKIWQGVVAKDVPTEVNWDGRNAFGASVASGIYYVVAVPKGPKSSAPKAIKAVLLR